MGEKSASEVLDPSFYRDDGSSAREDETGDAEYTGIWSDGSDKFDGGFVRGAHLTWFQGRLCGKRHRGVHHRHDPTAMNGLRQIENPLVRGRVEFDLACFRWEQSEGECFHHGWWANAAVRQS